MFKWGRQGAYRTIPSLSEDLLFLLLTLRHILVQICVCVRLYFIWGRQILCILVRVKIFPKQRLSQKENHSQLESLLVRHYTTMWEMYVHLKDDRRIGGLKTGNVSLQSGCKENHFYSLPFGQAKGHFN